MDLTILDEKPVVGAKLASHVAMNLDDAGLDNVLWGFQAISFAGEMMGYREVEFVVPDAQMRRAVAVLVHIGFTLCEDSNCIELHADRFQHSKETSWLLALNRHHTVAEAHFHQTPFIVSLIRKSDVLWWLDFESRPNPPVPNDPDLMLSNDSRLPRRIETIGPCGPWNRPHLRPFRILSPNTLTEAILTLLARDSRLPGQRGLEWQWVRKKWALLESSERPDTAMYKRALRPKFRLAWDYLNDRKPVGHHGYIELLRMRAKMIENDELSRDLPAIDITPFLPEAERERLQREKDSGA